MRHVMRAVPGVQCRRLPQGHRAAMFGVHEATLPFRRCHRIDQRNQAVMQAVEKAKGRSDRQRAGIREFGPERLEVRLDRRRIFGQREPETTVCIQV